MRLDSQLEPFSGGPHCGRSKSIDLDERSAWLGSVVRCAYVSPRSSCGPESPRPAIHLSKTNRPLRANAGAWGYLSGRFVLDSQTANRWRITQLRPLAARTVALPVSAREFGQFLVGFSRSASTGAGFGGFESRP